MPSSAEARAAARGGIKGYRTVTLKDGRTILVAIVPKGGPRGGHTVALRGPVERGQSSQVESVSRPKLSKQARQRLRERLRRKK